MRPWIAGLALLMFVSGAASGFAVGRSDLLVRRGGDIPTRREMLDACAREVGLDAVQRARFDQISDANHERFVKVRARIEPDLAEIRSDVRAQMRVVLTDDGQRSRFDAFFQRRDKQRAEH